MLASHSEVQTGSMAHVFAAKGLGPLDIVKLFGVDFTENIVPAGGRGLPSGTHKSMAKSLCNLHPCLLLGAQSSCRGTAGHLFQLTEVP